MHAWMGNTLCGSLIESAKVVDDSTFILQLSYQC